MNYLWGIFGFLLTMEASAAAADFVVTSELEGIFCSGFIIEKCSTEKIAAFSENEDSQLFSFADQFRRVDEHNSKLSRCWLKNRNKYHAWAYTDGDYELLGVPDSVTFKCREE